MMICRRVTQKAFCKHSPTVVISSIDIPYQTSYNLIVEFSDAGPDCLYINTSLSIGYSTRQLKVSYIYIFFLQWVLYSVFYRVFQVISYKAISGARYKVFYEHSAGYALESSRRYYKWHLSGQGILEGTL